MPNRKRAESTLLTIIKAIAPGGHTLSIYKRMLADMDDKAFDTFINQLESGERFLIVVAENFGNEGITVENNLKVADDLGHNFFQKLWIEGKDGQPTYLTPIEYMIVDLPIRRASQMLTKKISVTEDNKTVDALTGQPTGESKGARVSYPELQVCAAMGLENSMVELMKYMGGDIKGMAAYNAMISQTGKANLNTLQHYSSGVESTKSVRTFLNAMMLRANL